MKNKSKFISIFLVFCMILIVFVALTFTILHAFDASVAYATEVTNLEEQCKMYTDSDTIYGMSLTINDYTKNLYASNAKVKNDDVVVYGDDPIVNIIPRQFFIDRGNHFYIGKEYGFFC